MKKLSEYSSFLFAIGIPFCKFNLVAPQSNCPHVAIPARHPHTHAHPPKRVFNWKMGGFDGGKSVC